MRTYDELLHDKELSAENVVDWVFEIMNTEQPAETYSETAFLCDLANLLDRWEMLGENP